MKLDPNDFTKIIKEQIKNYQKELTTEDSGTIFSVGDGICLINGLDKVVNGELLKLPNNSYALALNLETDYVGAVILGDDSKIKEGDIVKRTNNVIEVGVGDSYLGRVVNSLGIAIDGLGKIKYETKRPIERIAYGVMDRSAVNTPLQTGIKAIDAMVPIGRGQRELIIGDRQTGKTTIAIDTIINQKNKNVYCIYVAIGQKNSTVAMLAEKLRNADAMEYTTIVSSTSSESAPLQYIAPYCGVTIAEYWMEQGKDVLIVYDDLSKHAVSYRTMSLLLRRPPGREAYPGDVFYLHSRLLERAAKIKNSGSITALPIVETLAGDISSYIATNVISITDGQIFLQTELFNSGQRPAIDSGLSVSRVGGAAQIKAMRQVSGSLKTDLANFVELQAFAQFGTDLDETTKRILDHGSKVMAILNQKQNAPIDINDQIISLFALKFRFTDKISLLRIKDYEEGLIYHIRRKHSDIIEILNKEQIISNELETKLKKVISDYTEIFNDGLN